MLDFYISLCFSPVMLSMLCWTFISVNVSIIFYVSVIEFVGTFLLDFNVVLITCSIFIVDFSKNIFY